MDACRYHSVFVHVGVAFLTRELESKSRKRPHSSCDQPRTFKVEKSSGTHFVNWTMYNVNAFLASFVHVADDYLHSHSQTKGHPILYLLKRF